MSPNEQERILNELAKMDPAILDAEFNEQYMRCYDVYNNLPDWEQYTLTEMYDAITFEKKWYWRRKS